MKYLKLFEEYKYIKFAGTFNKYDEFYNDTKDKDEPFFLGSKRKYLKAKEEEDILRRREEKRRREKEKYRREIQKIDEQEEILLKFIDIIQNHPERISKFKYETNKRGSIVPYRTYGMRIGEDTIIVVYNINYINDKYVDTFIRSMTINDELISLAKKRENPDKEVDPYGEEQWIKEGETLPEVLGKLVKNYIEKNDIILELKHIKSYNEMVNSQDMQKQLDLGIEQSDAQKPDPNKPAQQNMDLQKNANLKITEIQQKIIDLGKQKQLVNQEIINLQNAQRDLAPNNPNDPDNAKKLQQFTQDQQQKMEIQKRQLQVLDDQIKNLQEEITRHKENYL